MQWGLNICGDDNGLHKITWVEKQALRSKGIVNSFIILALFIVPLCLYLREHKGANLARRLCFAIHLLWVKLAHCLDGGVLCWILYSVLGLVLFFLVPDCILDSPNLFKCMRQRWTAEGF